MHKVIKKCIQSLMQQLKSCKESKAYSVSVGIVKDGKVYTKHFGEIDKGKGNKADDNTYFP
jgi:CubicO group peptidase (beta-lactamase class C family)